jgi:exodeoxyribonuclease VII small subunit
MSHEIGRRLPILPNENDQHQTPCPPTFEAALTQLEAIVHQLEDGDVGLAEALARYEQGVHLLKQCYGLLERAERKIELLCGVDAQGNPITESFDDEASLSLDAKGPGRARRRSGSKAEPRDRRIPAEDAGSAIDERGSLF